MKKIHIRYYKAKTPLEVATKKILLRNIDKGGMESYFKDLFKYGCGSGIVSGLIYYCETMSFFKKNRIEIADLLSQAMSNYGASCPTELFGDKFDTDDFLCVEAKNQNLLAWFAFEETARMIADEIGIEVW